MPNTSFLAPQSLAFGPDGSLYALEWGGGYGRDNPNSGIYRIDYINGSRSPVAVGSATPDNGQEPLNVTFSSVGSADPEGGALTYAWDFDGNGTTDSTVANPTHSYTTPGVYQARLTVTDPAGKNGTTVIVVTVGNTKPTVKFNGPGQRRLRRVGRPRQLGPHGHRRRGHGRLPDLIVQPALGHDSHAHPLLEYRGKTGSVVTDLGSGHSEDMKVFFALDARYTDKGDGAVPALTGTDTVILQPKRKEAEHADGRSAPTTARPRATPRADGRPPDRAERPATGRPTSRSTSPASTRHVPRRVRPPRAARSSCARTRPTGDAARHGHGAVDRQPQPLAGRDDPGAGRRRPRWRLFLVFKGTSNFRLNFFEFNGKGLSPETRPTVKITAPAENAAVPPGPNTFTADATDAENAITKVEFFVDGEKIGEDTTAPYSVDWTQTTEKFYAVHAVATNARA